MTDFRYQGENAYPLLDAWIAEEAEAYWAKDDFTYSDNQMSRAAIHQYQLWGLLPIGDTPRFAGWWYHTDLATKQRWYGRLGGFDSEIGWRQYLERIEQKVATLEQSALDESRPISATFEPKQSGEQIVPIINSLANDQEAIYQVNIPNRGPLIPGFPEDLVVETQGVVTGSGIHGVMPSPLPPKLVAGAMIPRWHQAELVAQAVRQADSDLLLLYILNSHHSRSLEQAEALLTEWLADPRNERVRKHFGARLPKTSMHARILAS
jgi:alpha-galactosidase